MSSMLRTCPMLAAILIAAVAASADTPTTLGELTTRANAGDANAQAELGRRYYSGNGTDIDYRAAVKWLRKARKTVPAASTNLGTCYFHGRGIPKNHTMAVRLWTDGLKAGDKQARALLTMYGTENTRTLSQTLASTLSRAEKARTELKTKVDKAAVQTHDILVDATVASREAISDELRETLKLKTDAATDRLADFSKWALIVTAKERAQLAAFMKKNRDTESYERIRKYSSPVVIGKYVALRDFFVLRTSFVEEMITRGASTSEAIMAFDYSSLSLKFVYAKLPSPETLTLVVDKAYWNTVRNALEADKETAALMNNLGRTYRAMVKRETVDARELRIFCFVYIESFILLSKLDPAGIMLTDVDIKRKTKLSTESKAFIATNRLVHRAWRIMLAATEEYKKERRALPKTKKDVEKKTPEAETTTSPASLLEN